MQKLKDNWIYLALAGAGIVVAAYMFKPAPAKAFTGCGVGIGASLVTASIDFGAPVDISSSGQQLDIEGRCSAKMGTSPIIMGAFVNYGHVFGDLKTVGVESQLNVGGTLGVLVNPGAHVYTHLAWARAEVNGLGSLDGWKFGPGIEVKIPNSPLYLDMRYAYGIWDVSDFTTADARSQEVRLGLVWRFQQPVPSIFSNESDPPPPKQRAPK